jgi:hypothetical protein
MFAAMFFERDPDRLSDALTVGLRDYFQDVGVVAAIALLLWLLLGYTRMRAADRARIPDRLRTLFLLCTGVAAVSYLVFLGAWVPDLLRALSSGSDEPLTAPSRTLVRVRSVALTVGGVAAVLAVLLPFLADLPTMRMRRIWALTRLSFKESIRRRILWAFAALALVFLFASWFITSKPEDQVRTYVQVVYWAMTPLLLLASVLLASFSLPADMKNQTIHTILTKPVQRFEVVLGRFLGFTALMTVILFGLTAISLFYVFRTIDPDAAEESLKAREPLYGDRLRFERVFQEGDLYRVQEEERGENVGKEWDYRSYINKGQPGHGQLYAVWDFSSVPSSLADRKQVRCEFNFDIYRTTKGQENQGVPCTFFFRTWNYDEARANDKKTGYAARRNELRADREVQDEARRKEWTLDEVVNDRLAEEFGSYEIQGVTVRNFHTLFRNVPGGLFRNAQRSDGRRSDLGPTGVSSPLQVRVRCEDANQFVGMAKYDLYLRQDNPESGWDRSRFAVNFIKGAFGLWFRLCLMIGLAVALSTSLNGVISLLVTLWLYLHGLCKDFIVEVALGKNIGGGPLEALIRLVNRQNMVAQLEETTTLRVATGSDTAFRWFLNLVLKVIPDVDRYDLTSYVAEGFNIPVDQLLVKLIILLAYLLPWAVLAYYLIKWREIAAPT